VATKKKTPSLAIGRGEKLPVSKGAGLTAKGRACEVCKVDISSMRSDARFCSRKHKAVANGANRNYAQEYQTNKDLRQKQAMVYYYADHEKSKELQRNRQKNRLDFCAAYEAKRRAEKMQRTPKWLTEHDLKVMNGFYSIAAMLTRENKEPWHVDHIIPLRGEKVSGLHVPSNLQVMRGVENVGKNNRYEVV